MSNDAGAGSGANLVGEKPAHIREFTSRAVIAAIAVAAIIGVSYPYVVLKLGFGPNISVVSAFFGFLMLGLVSRSYNRWENNIVQTAGTAAGQIAFLCWLLAAFDMLADEKGSGFDVRLTMLQTFLWLASAGLLGVFLAVPLRRHFIVDEKLTFADGVAAGETLLLLDSKGPQARRSAFSMVGAMAISAATMGATTLKWFTDFFGWTFNAFSKAGGVGWAVSWLNIGSGMIIGVRICSSMLLGAIASWIVIPVLLADNGILTVEAKKADILLWVMWPATGMLVAGGLTALALKWRVLLKTFEGLRGASVNSGDFPMRWVLLGSLLSTIALVVVQKAFIGTPVWHTLVAIVLSLPLMLVALRVLGETNWGPISTMTNVMQALFGAVAPGDLRAGMVSSGITGSVAAESEGLMQDYKTGHMIGSTPRFLTYMQILAVPIGALALAWVYPQLRDTYGFTGDHGLTSPASTRWVGFAKVLSKGFSALPAGATPALAVGALLGILFTLLEQLRRVRPFVPSPTGVGIGMLVPFSSVIGMFVGSLIDLVWRKVDAKSATNYSIPIASGLIAGEALIAVVIAILAASGIWSP